MGFSKFPLMLMSCKTFDGRRFVPFYFPVLLNSDTNGEPSEQYLWHSLTACAGTSLLLERSSHVTSVVRSGMSRFFKCWCLSVVLQVSTVTGQSGEEATVEESEVTNTIILLVLFASITIILIFVLITSILIFVLITIIQVTSFGEDGSTTASEDYYYYEVKMNSWVVGQFVSQMV